jgi:arylsulfatase A
VIFTSDNGCAPYIGVDKLEAQGHFPSADRRGYKADIFDGGHRIPLIARWPGKIPSGKRTDRLACLTDLMATCAELVGATLPPNAGEDSVSLLPLMTGRSDRPPRDSVVLHSIDGKFAIRQGRWKLELCPGSGGWSNPKDSVKGLPPVQLYDMEADVGEQHNVQAEHPDVVRRLTELLESIVAQGRSTPGPGQKNDVRVTIRKDS